MSNVVEQVWLLWRADEAKEPYGLVLEASDWGSVICGDQVTKAVPFCAEGPADEGRVEERKVK